MSFHMKTSIIFPQISIATKIKASYAHQQAGALNKSSSEDDFKHEKSPERQRSYAVFPGFSLTIGGAAHDASTSIATFPCAQSMLDRARLVLRSSILPLLKRRATSRQLRLILICI
jgi:hypothetical protein